MPGQPNDPKDADLLALRDRLRQARAERGSCPAWDELKADLVPGGAGRAGRDERQAHAAICPYCGEHVREWRKSLDYEADRLAAIEKGVATGIVRGAKGLGRAFGRTLSGRGARKPAEAAGDAAQAHEPETHEEGVAPTFTDAPQRMYKPPAETPETHEESVASPFAGAPQRMYTPPAETPEPAFTPPPPPAAGSGLARVLVVEMADGRTPPQSVYLCAQVLEAEVAQVDSVDELVGDPDLALVCGVILGGMRRPETWPDAVRHARKVVPKRPVILLATYGAEPPAGARRALGDALQSESDPAERLLLALDSRLR